MYALLFSEHGLSAAEISSLFIIWSSVTFVVEIPSGLWADLFSRRRLLILAPLVTGTGYGLWTWLPSYPAFAAGFVLWGVGSSLRSGTLQALVYEELGRREATDTYARLMGRSQAMGTTAMMAATAAAGPVLHLGGYGAVGAASVAVCVLGALVARTFPDSRAPRGTSHPAGAPAGTSDEPEASDEPEGAEGPEAADEPGAGGFVATLRTGLGELRGSPSARDAVLLTSAVTGALMIDEYVPLLIGSMDVAESTVPLLMLLVTAGVAAGGWCAGRGARLLGPALAL
ncbi:MFS transporter, partial [Streptomyces nanshensis]